MEDVLLDGYADGGDDDDCGSLHSEGWNVGIEGIYVGRDEHGIDTSVQICAVETVGMGVGSASCNSSGEGRGSMGE